MHEVFVCDGCGHQADGVKDLLVLESFAGGDAAGDLEMLLVECRCGDRAEIPVPAAA